MPWIGIYIRVSSKRQDLRSQEPDLRRWSEAFAEGATVKWYRDKVTGKNMDRPGWRQLEADMDGGRIATLVCWRLDRLGRTASGLTTLFDKLVARKIGFVSLKDGMDLATPAGRLTANVLASVAVFENEVRSERIAAGQAAARAAGKTWGGSVKGRRVKVKPEQAVTIRRLREEGMPITAIGRVTGLSRPTVYSVLGEASLA